MIRRRLIAVLLAAFLASGIGWEAMHFAEAAPAEGAAPPPAAKPGFVERLGNGLRSLMGGPAALLRARVINAETGQPINGARCVLAETRQEIWSGEDGWTPTIRAPIIRDPRIESMLAELHGQLTLICYKAGFRDTIFMGVRMHEGLVTEPEVWLIPATATERRKEPWLYQMPIHRIWRIQLADKFRSENEPGEGYERPER